MDITKVLQSAVATTAVKGVASSQALKYSAGNAAFGTLGGLISPIAKFIIIAAVVGFAITFLRAFALPMEERAVAIRSAASIVLTVICIAAIGGVCIWMAGELGVDTTNITLLLGLTE